MNIQKLTKMERKYRILQQEQNAILKRRELTNIEELAADANYDKEQITIKDLVRIQIIILNPPKM